MTNIVMEKDIPETKSPLDNDGLENSGRDEQKEPGQTPNCAGVQESQVQVVDIQTERSKTENPACMAIDVKRGHAVSPTEMAIPQAIEKAVGIWTSELRNRGAVDRDTIVQHGIELLRALASETNMVINFAARSVAKRAIVIGKICIELKRFIKDGETSWEAWAEQNLQFIEKRNRQKYMRIAARHDCHDFIHLGVDRMDMLCAATKGSLESKPIHALLNKYGLLNDTTSEVSTAEFKKKIDGVLSHERLLRHDLDISFDLVMEVINNGQSFDKAIVKRLEDSRDSGENPEILVKDAILVQGNDGPEDDDEKCFRDFITLSSRLIKTIDVIITNEGQVDSLDKEIFEFLVKKLIELQEVTGLNFYEAQ